MTKQELNRDIKRLKKAFYKASLNDATYYEVLENSIKKEFLRLYGADNNFEYMSKENVLFMLRLNLRCRFVALHTFGLNIEL